MSKQVYRPLVIIALFVCLVFIEKASAVVLPAGCIEKTNQAVNVFLQPNHSPVTSNICINQSVRIMEGLGSPSSKELVVAVIKSYDNKNLVINVKNKKYTIKYKKLVQIGGSSFEDQDLPDIPLYISYLGEKDGLAQVYFYLGEDVAESNLFKEAKGIVCSDSDKVNVSYDGNSTDLNPYVNIYKKGTVVGLHKSSGKQVKLPDTCLDSKRLQEYFCNSNTQRVDWKIVKCENGCKSGICQTKNFLMVESMVVPSIGVSSISYPPVDGYHYNETLGMYNFSAITSKEDIEIESMELAQIYTDLFLSSPADYKEVWWNSVVPDASIVYGSKISPSSPHIKFNFTPGELVVKAGEEKALSLQANFNEVGKGNLGVSGHLVGYKQPENIVARSLKTGKLVKVGYGKVRTNSNYLYRTSPFVQCVDPYYVDSSLKYSGNVRRLVIHCDVSGSGVDISLYQLAFEFFRNNPDIKIEDLRIAQAVNGFWTVLNDKYGQLDGNIWRVNSKDWSSVYPEGFIPLAKDGSGAFRVEAKVWGTQSDDQIFVRFLGDKKSSAIKSNIPATASELKNSGANFIWSDNSAETQSLDSKDWLDGRNIRGFNDWMGPYYVGPGYVNIE